jgi:hypothetical protein
VDVPSVFQLVNIGVQNLLGEIRIFGMPQVDEFEIGSMCHLVDDTFEGLSHTGHCYHHEWFKG